MILDDETSLRELLKKIVPWKELGLEVVGEAASGVEAINKIDDVRPHIAIVDIMMPFMSGIEFSRIALERYPELKIIVLTAYEDFSYAKECISLGVSDYLLKPIDRKELEKTLLRVADTIKEEVETPDAESMVEASPADETQGSMEQVKCYLQCNYQNSSMNLTSVAQKFGFHPSYLSRRFKTEMGQTFIDYLTQFRMDRAEEMAKEGVLMYVAAEKTGIIDPNYFGKCFKKYKGISYSEFVKKHKMT